MVRPTIAPVTRLSRDTLGRDSWWDVSADGCATEWLVRSRGHAGRDPLSVLRAPNAYLHTPEGGFRSGKEPINTEVISRIAN